MSASQQIALLVVAFLPFAACFDDPSDRADGVLLARSVERSALEDAEEAGEETSIAVVTAAADPVQLAPGEMPEPGERACDGVDQDGDGADFCPPDADGDGVREHLDCNDADAATSPREIETQCDDIDQNCDGHDDCDADHDGLLWPYDCDDDDPAVTHQCRGPAVPSEREP